MDKSLTPFSNYKNITTESLDGYEVSLMENKKIILIDGIKNGKSHVSWETISIEAAEKLASDLFALVLDATEEVEIEKKEFEFNWTSFSAPYSKKTYEFLKKSDEDAILFAASCGEDFSNQGFLSNQDLVKSFEIMQSLSCVSANCDGSEIFLRCNKEITADLAKYLRVKLSDELNEYLPSDIKYRVGIEGLCGTFFDFEGQSTLKRTLSND